MLLHFRSRILGERPLGICSAAAFLQMELETSAVPVCERTGYLGEHALAKDGKRLSYFSCILFLLAGDLSLTKRLYFSEENYDSFYRTLLKY